MRFRGGNVDKLGDNFVKNSITNGSTVSSPTSTTAVSATNSATKKTITDDARRSNENGFFELPHGYVNKYNLDRGDFPPLTPDEALLKCRREKGKVDIEYIASLCLTSLKDAILSLEGKIYRDCSLPGDEFYKNYVTAEEYFSGNLYKKYECALRQNKRYDGAYNKNIKALLSVMPERPAPESVYFGLGSPWIPPDYVADFVQYLYRVSLVRNKRICEVYYERAIHRYVVILNVDVRSTVLAIKTFGTERMDMFKILDKSLNHDQIHITDLLEENGRIVRRLNREQTLLAEEKRTKLKQAFSRWMSELPPEKKQPLYDMYYSRFACIKNRLYCGDYLDFSDMHGATLYGYQRDAVARIIESKTTLLAHDVGAGKTFVMIAAGHIMRKTALSKKNMFVVPNAIAAQWKTDYNYLYPDARVLAVTPEDFSPARREQTLQKMAEDFEAIIIPYSSFELIPPDYDGALLDIREKISVLQSAMQDNSRRLQKARVKIGTLLAKEEEHLKRQAELYRKKQSEIIGLNFGDLNINTLFIDEAHNYKNLPLDSNMGQIKGLNAEGSEKCADVYLKTRTVLRQNGGRGLVFATGTPVTNSVADVFVMQKFLGEELLAEVDVDVFDNWAGTFGEITRDYEIDVDTESYRLTARFNRFNNLEQLSKMLNLITDFHVCERDGLPRLDSVETVLVQKSEAQSQMLANISERVEKIRAGQVDRKTDNLLKVTTDGRKIALDVRLVCDEPVFSPGNKIGACAKKLCEISKKFAGTTQLVFCDIGTPKMRFNVYDELKKHLIMLGFPPDEIAFVHDGNTERQREKIFDAVNAGKIRVLIGSTFKLGTGVNVQRRLIAVHHLDVPWRPSDMVQREGRLIRQGNTNEKVYVFRYVTKGSFDAYSWQLLENKQRFISDLMSGAAKNSDERQLADSVLSYAEVKALAVGNPLVKSRVQTFNELMRYKTLSRENDVKRRALSETALELPAKLSAAKERLSQVRADAREYEKNPELGDNGLIGRLISAEIAKNVLSNSESFICNIGSFRLYVPAGFNRLHPYLVIYGNARYTVDINTFGSGAAIKVEGFLKKLRDYSKELALNVDNLEMQKRQIEAELAQKDEYADIICELSDKLAEIDKQLGIN